MADGWRTFAGLNKKEINWSPFQKMPEQQSRFRFLAADESPSWHVRQASASKQGISLMIEDSSLSHKFGTLSWKKERIKGIRYSTYSLYLQKRGIVQKCRAQNFEKGCRFFELQDNPVDIGAKDTLLKRNPICHQRMVTMTVILTMVHR